MSSDFVQAFLKKTYFECGNKLCYKILLNQKGCWARCISIWLNLKSTHLIAIWMLLLVITKVPVKFWHNRIYLKPQWKTDCCMMSKVHAILENPIKQLNNFSLCSQITRFVHRVRWLKIFNELSGKMSSFSGIGGKNDKSKGKFTAINLNNYFQGKPTAPAKNTGKNSLLF